MNVKRGKKRFFSPKMFLGAVLIAALAAYGLTRIADLNFWIAFPIVILAILVNGLIATSEDNASGGFNDPDLKHRKVRNDKGRRGN